MTSDHAEPLTDFEPPAEVDDYVIGRELGRGTDGCVYVAHDAMLDREVAIKFASMRVPDARARQQLLLEARALAKLDHPNIVRVYRVGELGERPYIVSQLVRGTPLSRVPVPMASEAALPIAIDLARGLAAVHRGHIVHCDLKPANVIMADDGPKIVDFGLARAATDAAGAARGAPAGTPSYMAPEVWAGASPTRRSDVYSLGAVIYELVAGAPPFADVAAAALRDRVQAGEAPPLRERAPGADARLAEVVARCLARDPAARFADGDELREALEALQPARREAVRRGENPYRGLLAFEAAHRGVFFGRSSEIDAVVARLRAAPAVIVAGDSGVGKSSLCRAGVVPAVLEGALGPGAWAALVVVPGRHPLRALAAALGDPDLAARLREAPELLPRELRRWAAGRGLIVFIDQIEELITLGDPGEVAALDAALGPVLEGLPGVRVLAAARADFLARLAALPRLGRDLSRLLYILRPLPPERLREVIAGPARATGVTFESDAIVDELVAATAQAGAGGLPLLSFALADLWEARDRARDVITRASVREIGGVAGALARHADDVLAAIPAERGHARAILTRLVSAEGTRARRTAEEVAPSAGSAAALDALVRGRLVVSHESDAGPVYELAHEVLIGGWGTLRDWLGADAEGRARRERLAAATAEWERVGRRAEATWQGSRLDEALALPPEPLTAGERAFLAASVRAARRRRAARWGLALGALALVALAFGVARHLAGRRLERAIAGDLAMAAREHAAARRAAEERAAHAAAAFSAFDAGRAAPGEAAWRRALAARAEAERRYRLASQYLEAAVVKDPARAAARDLLGDVLLERALLADTARDPAARGEIDELVQRLALHDGDGSRRARWSEPGRVIVRAPPGAAIAPAEGAGAPIRLGTGTAALALAPGSYLILVDAPGRAPVRAPVLVERGREVVLAIEPPPAPSIPPGFVYVPPGELLYGSASEADRSFFDTAPLHRRATGAYLIARAEVTFGEWLAYLEALPAPERERRRPGVARGISGALAVTADPARRWRLELQLLGEEYTAAWGEPLVYRGRARLAAQDWRRFPVLGISPEDALAYAAWLDRTGRVPGARLCGEVEWERAARGADGRAYPAGDRIDPADAALDATHGRARMGPDEVGSHPASTSPFGLVDTVGNAFELTRAEDGGFALRGGSYQHDRRAAHLANRSPMPAGSRDAAVGVRLCADPPAT